MTDRPIPFRVMSLGAGVQSSTLALMAARSEIEPPDCAIFADTGAEPAAVYRHLEWLEQQRMVVSLHGHAPARRFGAHAPQLQEIAQSTLRGVADGVAGPLDPDRIDALRMLGNGVVPLAGAHAVRSLGVALARRHGTDPARFIWGVT